MKISPISYKVLRTLFTTQYAYMLEYRVEVALWALSGILPFIMYAIWSENLENNILDIGSVKLARYFLSAFIVRQFSVVWVVFSFEEDSLSGRISPYLLQPVHPLIRYLMSHLAEQATRLPFVFLISFFFFLLNPESLWIPSISQFILFIISTQLAFYIAFLLQGLVASLCFWTEKASALERLIFIPYLFLSGLLVPLSFFPKAIYNIALFTPFPFLINFPARILSGDSVNLLNGFSSQLLWICILFPSVLFIWNQGVKRYSAMGA